MYLLISTAVLFVFLLRRLLPSTQRGLPLPPGPIGWPILGNLPQLGKKPHQTLAAFSRKHGPLFSLRFGSVKVVVASSSSVAASFLKTHDAIFSNRPPNSTAEHVAYNYGDVSFGPPGPRWRELRKICFVHLVSVKALEEFRRAREEEAAALANDMVAGGGVKELGKKLNFCAVNALSRAVMGRRVFGKGLGKEAEEFQEMVVELMQLAGVFNVGDFVPWLKKVDFQGVVKRMKSIHRRFGDMLNKMIKSQEETAGRDKHLLSCMLAMRGRSFDDEGGALNDTDVKALLLDLFTAGTDTTSSTVEWAIREMIRHPQILKRAQEEIDGVVGRGRLVSDLDIAELPFLRAVVKEVFRLHPAAPLSLPRMAAESCEIAGYHIPKGATLLVNIWSISRDPDTWQDLQAFPPERFLPGGDHAEVDVRGTDFEIIPFGAGRRICAGLNLGLRMVQFLTATLVHAFDWELPPGEMAEKLDMEEAYGLTLQRAVPLRVQPLPRLEQKAYFREGDFVNNI